MVLELGGKGLVGGVVLGGDDEAAGVPVDAVDDPRTQSAPHAATIGFAAYYLLLHDKLKEKTSPEETDDGTGTPDGPQ